MNVKRFFLIPFAIIAISACNNGIDDAQCFEAPIDLKLSATEMKLTDEGQVFGMDLFSAVSAKEKDKDNIVISPLSLNMALAMVWNGANGETKQAIQKVMGMNNYSPDEVNAYFKKLREVLPETDPATKLSLANSIWTKQGFPVKESFYKINKDWYNAKVSELDFSSPTAKDVINQWCADNTNGLIEEMITEKIPADVVMYLMNALYFKSEWAKNCGFPKSETKDADFRQENGETLKVKMMSQNSEQVYYADEHLAMASLPYGNGAYRMVFMLPNGSFDNMIDQLKQPGYLSDYLRSGSVRELNLFIPKFKIEFETNLNEPLIQMGMGIAFAGADFSGISDIALAISKVKQKTYIEVNEEGTEAAAVTSIEMRYTSVGPPQPATFRADRPFLFLIQESSSGVILFMGKIGKPA